MVYGVHNRFLLIAAMAAAGAVHAWLLFALAPPASLDVHLGNARPPTVAIQLRSPAPAPARESPPPPPPERTPVPTEVAPVPSVEQVHRPPAAAAAPAPVHANENESAQPEEAELPTADILQHLPPRYPRRAVELGMQGTVILHVLVDRRGMLRELRIGRSSGYGLLDKAALAAVERWRFAPPGGGELWMQVPVEFLLN